MTEIIHILTVTRTEHASRNILTSQNKHHILENKSDQSTTATASWNAPQQYQKLDYVSGVLSVSCSDTCSPLFSLVRMMYQVVLCIQSDNKLHSDNDIILWAAGYWINSPNKTYTYILSVANDWPIKDQLPLPASSDRP